MWLLFASLTAFFEACKDATGKQSLKTLDEYSVLFSFMACGVVFMLPVLWLVGIPPIQPGFWLAITVGGGLNILAFTLYVRALKLADLSLTVPLITLTPLFLLVTSPILVQEWPTWADAIGVVLLVMGSYVLNLKLGQETTEDGRGPAVKKGLGFVPLPNLRANLRPIRAMTSNPGSRLMLCVSFIWSITSNFDKIGVLNSSPLLWAIALFTVIAAGMVPFVFLRPNSPGIGPLLGEWRLLGLTGAFNAIAITFQMLALPMAPVAQVIAVKRMSALLSVFFGHFFFEEKGFKERLAGAAIMIGGVVIMALD